MKIYHNPRCRKSRETLKLIEDKGTLVEVVEYLKTPPTYEALAQIINKLGVRPFEIIRKGEEIYKNEFKGKELSDKQWIEAMVNHPKLMERPIVVKGEKAVIGRPPENVNSLL